MTLSCEQIRLDDYAIKEAACRIGVRGGGSNRCFVFVFISTWRGGTLVHNDFMMVGASVASCSPMRAQTTHVL